VGPSSFNLNALPNGTPRLRPGAQQPAKLVAERRERVWVGPPRRGGDIFATVLQQCCNIQYIVGMQ